MQNNIAMKNKERNIINNYAQRKIKEKLPKERNSLNNTFYLPKRNVKKDFSDENKTEIHRNNFVLNIKKI